MQKIFFKTKMFEHIRQVRFFDFFIIKLMWLSKMLYLKKFKLES